MVKFLFFLVLAMAGFVPAAMAATAPGDPSLAGGGAVMSTSPYAGVGTRTHAIPFFALEYKNFYIKGLEAGYRGLKAGDLTVSVIVDGQWMGYHAGDSAALEGMKDRGMSLGAGVKAEYALPWHQMTFTAKAVRDVLAHYDGGNCELSVSRPVRGRIFRFYPSVGVSYETRQMTDYYYGVRDDEARAGRPAYTPGSAADPFVRGVLSVGVSRNLIVLTMLRAESLAPEIRKSPLVNKSYALSAACGLCWRF